MQLTFRLTQVSSGLFAAALAAAVGSNLPGCERDATQVQTFSLRLRASSTTDQPVAGALFWADGRELGATAEDGSLRAQLAGTEGQSVALSSACPPSYRTLDPKRRLVLRRIGATTSQAPALELTAHCEPLEREAAIVVRVRGPEVAGLPIRVAGETVGQTESDGTAHLLLHVKPHSALRVQLMTEAHDGLLPRNPIQSFAIEDEDAILLVEQTLAPSPAKRSPRMPVRRARGPVLPYRID
ncbi:MAG: hypothetical protein ACHQ53_07260 [Polyangiales bacterium]